MIKRYCDRCGQQIDEGVHAWYVLELHGTDGEFRHKELCEECYEYLCEKDEVPKIEPQKKEVEWVYNKRERLWYPYSNGELLFKDEPQTANELSVCDGNCWMKREFGDWLCDDCQREPRTERSSDD